MRKEDRPSCDEELKDQSLDMHEYLFSLVKID